MWRDRIAGIVLGIALGVAIVAVFVFVYSEDAIDSASISAGAAGHGGRAPDGNGPEPQHVQAPVQVLGGAPPESGPAHVDAREGDSVTLTVSSDGAVTLELIGYGITKTVAASVPTAIEFKATQTGNFALINTATHIAVAQLRVDPR